MGIKESIANLRKALRTTQTNAPAVIDTLIRGLDGVETAAEEENTYSTEEKAVGTWIDGKTIYEKTFNVGALPNNTTKYFSHELTDIDSFIKIDGIGISGSASIAMPNSFGEINLGINVNSTVIATYSNANISTYTGYVTLRYTKGTANRAPENDTKNDGDEEKNTNER